MKFGYHHTEETRARMSLAHMGHSTSKETRAKISNAIMGKILTVETKAKISKARMGGTGYWLGKHRSEETRAKLSRAHMGTAHTEETKEKISQSLMGNKRNSGHHHTEEIKRQISQANLGKICTQETRAKLCQASTGNQYSLGCRRTEETRVEMSRVQKLRWQQDPEGRAKLSRDAELRWQDPEYKDKVLKASMLGRLIHPNKPESFLLGLLESVYPGEWKFVGDGELIIAGRNPDFWNGDHKLVELYGDWWHRGENPQERVDLFSLYGYQTLIVWESELDNPDKVLEKIVKFVRTPLRAE